MLVSYKAIKTSKILKWLPYLLFPIAAYFANVEIQSHLGRKALAETGLQSESIDSAIKLAKQEGKYVLADISAIWCGTCRRLDKEVLAAPAVRDFIAGNLVFSRLEYESEEGKAFMEQHDVSGFPTLLILDSNGNKREHLRLTFDPERFLETLSPYKVKH